MSTVSDNELCNLAYEGKFEKLQEEIRLKKELIHTKDQSGRVALHWAASGSHAEIVKYLLEQGSVIDAKDELEWTPLIISVSAGGKEVVNLLISQQADINAINKTGQSALHYAASKNRLKIAETLINHGAHVNIADISSKASPLHRAASRGHSKMVTMLLKYKADPNQGDIEGNTALHMACEEDRIDVAQILVEHDANTTIMNKEERTPLNLATKQLQNYLRRLME